MNTRNPGGNLSDHEAHVEDYARDMRLDETTASVGADIEGDGETPLHDVAPEGSTDAIAAGIFNTGSGSTGNAILDMSIGTTAGVTPSIDTLIGEEEGDGYTEPNDDEDEKDR